MGETREAEDKSQVAAVPAEANQPARRPAVSHLQLQALLAAQEVTEIHTGGRGLTATQARRISATPAVFAGQ